MATMIEEDDSRPIWPSCPSNGWTTGVDMLWSLPNGSPAGLQPKGTGPKGDAVAEMGTVPCLTADGAPANCTVLYNTDLNVGTK